MGPKGAAPEIGVSGIEKNVWGDLDTETSSCTGVNFMCEQKMCACGKPLHYTDPVLQQMVQQCIDEFGENIYIRLGDRVWLIPRHFIALHGIKAWELEKLGFPEVTNGDF